MLSSVPARSTSGIPTTRSERDSPRLSTAGYLENFAGGALRLEDVYLSWTAVSAGRADHNWMGDVASQLRDVANRDFRPREDSQLVGKACRVMGITDKYWIRRRDLGPYEFDCRDYWLPGYQTAAASRPIRADGARNAKPDADLIWLHGWQSERADVYLGTDPGAVAEATTKSPQFVGRRRNNILKPREELREGRAYYWRVDAVARNGKVIKGEVWSFTVRM